LKKLFNVKKLIGINKKIDNIFECPSPYWYLVNRSDNNSNNSQKNMVVFFGNDMEGVLGFGVSSKDQYVSRVNECLDYIRQNFIGFDLCYKSHPGDAGEQNYLNLAGFRILDVKITAEIFMADNLKKLRAVFTVGSFSAFNGYSMGIDSHVFYHCFSDIYNRDFIISLDQSFFEMPQSFFVKKLDQELPNNSRDLKNDQFLKSILKKNLDKNSGKIWLLCSFSEYTVFLGILTQIIRELSPNRQVGFIASYHHRWEPIRNYLNNYFDEVVFMPRIHYSIKPSRLWESFKIARQIRNFKMDPEDILMVASQPDFVENCFVSYHQNNHKIGLANKRDFRAQYDPKSLTYTAYDEFRFNKATWFFNKIFEPLLGIHRSLFLAFTSMNGFYFNRYQKPLNEIFDQLILFHVA